MSYSGHCMQYMCEIIFNCLFIHVALTHDCCINVITTF